MRTKGADSKRLVVWAFAGALLAASGLFTTLLPVAHEIWLWVFSAQVCTGFAVWFNVDSRLKRLYRAGAWSEEELAPTRALLAHPSWMIWSAVALLVAGAVTVALTSQRGGMIIMTVMPMNAISSMNRALVPSRATGVGLVDWKSFGPLHSEHWGEARRDELLPD